MQTSELSRNRSDQSIKSQGATLKNDQTESTNLHRGSMGSKYKLPRGAGFRNL